MTYSSIRQGLGISWFCLLVALTAAIIVAGDYEVESLQSAFSTYLATTLGVSLPVGLVAVGPFILFKRKRWLLGAAATPLVAIAFHSFLCGAQTPACHSTLQAFLVGIPKATLIIGGWLILISLPPALLLNRQ